MPTSLLVAISEAPEEAVLDGLRRLQAAEFLYEARLFPDSAYTFKHALTHDVAYSSLLIDRRRALHRQIVQTIERLYPDRLSEHVERLARHALRGELMEQAVAYGRQAGAKAMARFALREAAPHFEDALTALAHLPDTRQTLELAVDVRIQLRLAIHQLGQLERALAIAQEAERLAMKLGDDGRLGFLTCQIGMSHWLMGDKAAAHDAFERALGLATAAHDEELRLRGTYGIAVLAHDGGDYRQAATLMRTLLEELQARGSLTVRWGVGPLAVVTVVYLIWSLAEIGSFADATTLAADAIEHADAQNNPYSQTMTRLAAGIVHLRRGNIAEAIRPLERAIQLCETSGLTALGFHGIAASLGTAYMHSGRVADAIPLLERVASQARAMNVVSDHLLGAIPLAEAYLLSDRADDATRVALSSLTLARTYGQRGHEAFVHRVLGEIASRRDPASVDEAEAALGRSIELAESLGMRPLVARCHLALGQLHRRQGGPDPAQEHLAIAATMFAEFGMRP